ncbi:hypothetical protein GGX14DRAFT_470362 [Mycena pura]|uniref:Uncharacterized protein n=1 Tax=Mycena pura TaxID=153505 RepID=A0AAD6V2P8_9AGAR|nr:hypothetical protein GGX14DRAFT_470362 [Mycena pura]
MPHYPTSRSTNVSQGPRVSRQIPPLHLLEPPQAPRMPSVPLPSGSQGIQTISSGVNTTAPDPLPIDLRSDPDRDRLAQAIPNYSIPPASMIQVLPTTRDRVLISLTSGDRPTTAHALVRELHAIIHAPLSLPQGLPPDARQAVFNFFVRRRGPEGVQLWKSFLAGHQHPRGPTGADLLQGHYLLWGLWKDDRSRWVMEVDVPRVPRQDNPTRMYNY